LVSLKKINHVAFGLINTLQKIKLISMPKA